MYYYEPDTYYQQRARRLGAGDGCYSPDGIQVYAISETAYAELLHNLWTDDFIIAYAPEGEYVVVCGSMWFGAKYIVNPMYAFSRLLYAVEEVGDLYDYARRAVRRHIGVEYEIWHVVPDDELEAVYTGNLPEQPMSDTLSPVVIATDPDTGKQIVIPAGARIAYERDALDIAAYAISLGYDNVGIVWMRSDWAMSETLATACLYRHGYSLCHGDIAAKLGVVTNGRD